MRTFVVIPTAYKSVDTLTALLENLERDVSIYRIYVMNNTDKELPIKEGKTRVLWSSGRTIYQMWNDAWHYIKISFTRDEAINIAFLNDDIALRPNSIAVMERWLRADDQLAAICPEPSFSINAVTDAVPFVKYTETTAGDGGMTGYCFMVKGELDLPPIDENLTLYWGDDDLVKQIKKAGYKIGQLIGLPVEHTGSATIKLMNSDERWNIMEKDRKYFNEKYGESRGPVW